MVQGKGDGVVPAKYTALLNTDRRAAGHVSPRERCTCRSSSRPCWTNSAGDSGPVRSVGVCHIDLGGRFPVFVFVAAQTGVCSR